MAGTRAQCYPQSRRAFVFDRFALKHPKGEVTRIGKEVDNCELAQEHRQYILERQREVTEREQQASAGSPGTLKSQ